MQVSEYSSLTFDDMIEQIKWCQAGAREPPKKQHYSFISSGWNYIK